MRRGPAAEFEFFYYVPHLGKLGKAQPRTCRQRPLTFLVNKETVYLFVFMNYDTSKQPFFLMGFLLMNQAVRVF